MRVRAKFRCMSVKESQSSHADAEYLPVMPKGDCDPDGAEENRMFWDATPTGEASRHFPPEADRPKPGSFWYIDMEPDEEGDWHLEGVTLQGSASFDVAFGRYGNDRGRVTMGICNTDLYEFFIAEGLKDSRRWRVEFVPTEHGVCSYPYVAPE